MSNLYLAVEKVTESLVGNIKVKLSSHLVTDDKPEKGSLSPRTSSHFAVLVQRGLRPLLFVPCRGLFLNKIKTIVRFSILEKETAQSVRL